MKQLFFITVALFAIQFEVLAENDGTLCAHVLAVLSGAKSIEVQGNLRRIGDRSAHIRINEHEITMDFIESTIRNLGLRPIRQSWMQPTTAAYSRLWMRPDAAKHDSKKISPRSGLRGLLSDIIHRPPQEPGPPIPIFYSLRDQNGIHIARRLTNLIVDIESSDANPLAPTVIIGVHYDSVNNESGTWNGTSNNIFSPYQANPGADDNASGVAGAVELLRRFQLQKPAHIKIRFIFFDAEEPGLFGPLQGSRHYLSGLSSREQGQIAFALTLDMIGRGNYPKPDSYNASAFGVNPVVLKSILGAQKVTSPKPFIQIPGQRNFISVADSYNFNRAAIPNLLITDVISTTHLPSHYHNETDMMNIIDHTYMNGIVDQVETLVRALSSDTTLLKALADREAIFDQTQYLPNLGPPQ